MGGGLPQISFLALCPLNPNQKGQQEDWGEEKVIKALSGYPPAMTLMLNDLKLGITDSAGRKALTVSYAWMEKPLLSGLWGDCSCVFQTRSDEEDAENDDLNDAGESSSNTQLFCGESQDLHHPGGCWACGNGV